VAEGGFAFAGFAAGALAATAALTAQGSMNAEASTHIQP
jgi:hypothetical protein